MKHVAIVYWSGTGNTQALAELLEKAFVANENTVEVFEATDFHQTMMDAYDIILFGCPAMGEEELEETEFEPMFSECESNLSGKKIGLFGSYGWGDGEWMRTWEERCQHAGAELIAESIICADAPDGEAEEACKKIGSL